MMNKMEQIDFFNKALADLSAHKSGEKRMSPDDLYKLARTAVGLAIRTAPLTRADFEAAAKR